MPSIHVGRIPRTTRRGIRGVNGAVPHHGRIDRNAMDSDLTQTTNASEMFELILERCRELGFVGKTMTVEHEGRVYRISCSETGFVVYRVNENATGAHHSPGWPICLVTEDAYFEEHGCPVLGNDHFACGADIGRWLDILEYHTTR